MKCESRLGILPMEFKRILGSEDVFKHVGFSPARREDTGEVSTIKPPSASNPMARGALLRAWIELSAYISALRLNRSGMSTHYAPCA